MTRLHAIRRPVSPFASTLDAARVRVVLHTSSGNVELGNADEARHDRRLTAAERAAVANLVEAIRLLRTRDRLLGIDDAGTGVKLVLRDAEATASGPYASEGQIAVGAKNALASRSKARADPDALLPIDTAVHELTHVTQFARIPATAKADQGILEGIADAVAMLATGDDTVGEGYFRTDATGRHRGSIRDLGAHTVHGPTVGAVARTYLAATSPGVECHEAGGLISTTVAALRLALGRSRAEKLLWAVIRDSAAWAQGGSWKSVAAALQRAAANDVAAASAVSAALRQTGWDAALA